MNSNKYDQLKMSEHLVPYYNLRFFLKKMQRANAKNKIITGTQIIYIYEVFNTDYKFQ